MSAESGISTFRDSGGLWEKYTIEEVATPNAWAENPEKVQAFYNSRRKQIIDTQPNEAHHLLKDLERKFDVTIVTQNIDDLHERAGSSNVLHLHGNIRYAKSSGPDQEKEYYPIAGWELKMTDLCKEGFPLRPHVVWFGEDVPMYKVAMRTIEHADILLVIGTSLQVYPAAGLVNHAPSNCLKFIIDPLANEMHVGNDFNRIAANASNGLLKFFEIIKNLKE